VVLEVLRITYLAACWGLFRLHDTTTDECSGRRRPGDEDGGAGSGHVDRHDPFPPQGTGTASEQ
jgi:hypothetical protein